MTEQKKGLLPDWLQNGFVNLLSPVVRLANRLDLSPNTFTVLGLVLNFAATAVLIWDRSNINWTGFLILLGGICDILDGKIARTANKASKFGALFDSTIDRYSEVVMFFGIAFYYVSGTQFLLSVITFIALGGSTMVSYVRARAEGLGFEAKVGWMQRPERVVFVGFGALLHFPLFHISILHVTDFPVTLLQIAIWVVAILANFTAIQRIIHIYKQEHIN